MYDQINALVDALTTGLYERGEAIRLGLLASLAGESMFLLGPPGVGKSLIARRLQMVFTDAKNFSYLMGRFSTPDEVFGPLSIRKLKHEDRYERVTSDYLPDADVVFLDEIWKASPPIQNALLTALNERLYRNGSQEIALPLKVFIGASNELPEKDEIAAAFWDRFLIRLVLDPVAGEDAFRQLVSDTADIYEDVVPPDAKIPQSEFASLQERLAHVSLPPRVMALLAAIRARLGSQGEAWYVSDRRWKKITRLLRASAMLHGRDAVEILDCAVVRHCIWNSDEERETADHIVRDALAEHAGRLETIARFEERARSFEQRVSRSAVEVVHEEARVPVLHRDEYYRLVPKSSGDDSVTTLAWHSEIDALRVGEAGALDFFRYDPGGQLLGSEEVEAERTSEWSLRINGDEWEIETEERTISRSKPRTFDRAEAGEISRDTGKLIDEVESAINAMMEEQAALSDGAHQHLFVPRDYIELVTAALEGAAADLTKIRIRCEQVRNKATPG